MIANNRGYSLIEMLIVFIIIGLGISAVAVGTTGALSTMQPETVMAQTANVMLEAKAQALFGSKDETKRTFRLEDALSLPHNGVTITATPPSYGKADCNISACPDQQVICISGQATCFTPSNSFSFEPFSGKLSQSHAMFISNKKRTLGIMMSNTGNFTIAELVGSTWHSRTDLQQLVLDTQKTNTTAK